LALQTARAKSTKHNAATTHPCILGQVVTELKPGTSAGDSYCARSQGIEGSGKGSANYWARELWSCRGNKSVSDKPFFGKIKL